MTSKDQQDQREREKEEERDRKAEAREDKARKDAQAEEPGQDDKAQKDAQAKKEEEDRKKAEREQDQGANGDSGFLLPPPTTPPDPNREPMPDDPSKIVTEEQVREAEEKARRAAEIANEKTEELIIHLAISAALAGVVAVAPETMPGVASLEKLHRASMALDMISLSSEDGRYDRAAAEARKELEALQTQLDKQPRSFVEDSMLRIEKQRREEVERLRKASESAFQEYERNSALYGPTSGLTTIKAFSVTSAEQVESKGKRLAERMSALVKKGMGSSTPPAPRDAAPAVPAPAQGKAPGGEDNTTLARAAPLARKQTLQGLLTPGQARFFKIKLEAGEQLNLKIYLLRQEGADPRFNLAVADGFGGIIHEDVHWATAAEGDLAKIHTFEFTAPESDEFALRLSHAGEGANIKYRVIVA